MIYPRHYTIDNYLNKVRLHSEPYTAEILGKEITILPNVMSPKYDRSAQMMLSMMPNQKDKKVLEIGSGTGILSLFTLLQGAHSVCAVDVNPDAVKNTKINLYTYGFTNAEVFESDLFEKITGTFDTIIFNAPFHGNKAEDVLELGTSDFEYRSLTRFVTEAKRFLKQNGKILLGFADTGDNKFLRKVIQKNMYRIKEFQTYPNGDWVMYLYTLEVP